MSDDTERSVASAGSASGIPSIGQKVCLGSFVWEVVDVEEVSSSYDLGYTHRVSLVIRDKHGNPVNWSTRIPNTCLGGVVDRAQNTQDKRRRWMGLCCDP